MSRRLAVGLFVLFGLGACSFAGIVSRESTEYNGTIEATTNNLMLTNVLRASDHLPLYFATLSNIHGSLIEIAGFSLPVPFGPGKITGGKHFVDTLSGSLQNAPTFDIAPLDTQTFTEGMLAPIDLKVAQYYWDRNDYPKWLLANLFISKIEVRRDCSSVGGARPEDPPAFDYNAQDPLIDKRTTCQRPPLEVLQNDPASAEKQFRFEQFIREWLNPITALPLQQAYFYSYPKDEPQGPSFAKSQVRFQDLVGLGGKAPATTSGQSAAGSNLHLQRQKDGTFQLVSSSQAITICPPLEPSIASSLGDAKALAGMEISMNSASAATQAFEKQQTRVCPVPGGGGPDSTSSRAVVPKAKPGSSTAPPPKITIYQRSVSQMYAYLGALVRNPDNAQMVKCNGVGNPVGFYLRQGEPPRNAVITLDYRGAPYYVMPFSDSGGITDRCGNYSGGADYTTKVIALMNELLNLSKSASDLPVTKNVTVSP